MRVRAVSEPPVISAEVGFYASRPPVPESGVVEARAERAGEVSTSCDGDRTTAPFPGEHYLDVQERISMVRCAPASLYAGGCSHEGGCNPSDFQGSWSNGGQLRT